MAKRGWSYVPGRPDAAFRDGQKAAARAAAELSDHQLVRIISTTPTGGNNPTKRSKLLSDVKPLLIKASRPGETIGDLGAYVKRAQL